MRALFCRGKRHLPHGSGPWSLERRCLRLKRWVLGPPAQQRSTSWASAEVPKRDMHICMAWRGREEE
eukprot:12289842-Alexandrium_andersonii.AAC.1